jgi:2-polyprenyl-3-methyl-5-hydroxy-6-metoxy-1,4-benzoquinol methylase/ADP-ribose pyrophosphatase YjhB (NUDIX family)
MPDLLSAALFQRGDFALVTRRKPGRGPFAGQWLLPLTTVPDSEAAEDALRRHAREQFSLTLGEAQFVETVYLEDGADQRRYVANIFRAVMEGGPLRFNAEGDYDDARWLGAADLAQLDMPAALRDPLVQILSDPDYTPQTDWSAAGEAVPLGERDALPAATLAAEIAAGRAAPPDNRAGWDAISAAYQRDRFGDRYADSLMWSWHLREDDVRLLDDVRGKRVLALGCGGGQDVVALSKMGAVAVGIDVSEKQIEYAKEYAQRHGAQNASFAVGSVEDLSRFDDESFDAAVAAHMLNYVQRIDDTLREVHRVLRGGGVLAISVRHPFDVTLSDAAPYRVQRAYWDTPFDWTWDFASGELARFRQWFWTVSQWFDLLTRAGFTVERLLEPREEADAGDGIDAARARLVPYTLLIKARKR